MFTRELARRGILSEGRLLSLVDQTAIDESVRVRIRNQIARDFHAQRDLDSVREIRTADSQQQAADTASDLEAINETRA